MTQFNLKTKAYNIYQENLNFQYNAILRYKINKNKSVYLSKVYKNYSNDFLNNTGIIKLLYKKNYELFAYDFILRHPCSVHDSTSYLLSCIINNNIKKSLYIYKQIKKEIKNYTFFLSILYNETNRLNKKPDYHEKLTFNFSMLDMYIKTEQHEEFWINILETINLIILKKNSITKNKFYDRFDIKPLV